MIEAPKPEHQKIAKHAGFGLTLRQYGERVIVVNLDKDGMAKLAGVRKGDVLETIGTIPVVKPVDIAQLDKVLKPGDQVEFEFARKKKSQKVMISFEKEVDMDETGSFVKFGTKASPDANASPLPRSASNQGTSKVRRLEELVESQQQTIDDLRGRLSLLETSQSEFEKEFAIEVPTTVEDDKPLLILK